jgi:hypothetical protein
MLGKIAKSLAAILIGNAVYFFVVAPHIPAAGRHQPFRIDLGLLIDFWVCLGCWAAIEMVARRRSR